jgi:hypothetical protein
MSADHSIDQKTTICIDEILDTLELSGRQALLTHLERDAGARSMALRNTLSPERVLVTIRSCYD